MAEEKEAENGLAGAQAIAGFGCRRSKEGASQGPEGNAHLITTEANMLHMPQNGIILWKIILRLEHPGPTQSSAVNQPQVSVLKVEDLQLTL